jgi:dTDP-4-dehydrorhamnose reductase
MVWLIGNRGMLGSDVEELFHKRNIEYIATDLEVDIADYQSLVKFSQEKSVDWIINCAAYTNVDGAEDEEELAFQINAQGPRNIANIAHTLNAKLIHLSTDYVFDGTKKDAYTEDDEPNPQSIYGKSKLQGERHVQNTLDTYYIIRTAWLYGKKGKNFVNTMLRLLKERDEISVVDDQWGSPTYIKDLAEAIVMVVQSDCRNYGLYHFTNEGRTNWFTFAKRIYDEAKKRDMVERKAVLQAIGTAAYPTKAKRPRNSYLAKEKFKTTFHHTIPAWAEALQRFFDEMVQDERIGS